jgi:hypothetical protein
MTIASQRRIVASGGVVLLALAVFVLLVSIAQAAQPLTQLQRAHDGANVAYAAAPLSQLQRAHDGANVAYAAAPLSQLQRAHDGASVAYAAAGPVGSASTLRKAGVFVSTNPAPASTASFIGGIALAIALVALVAFLALGSRASRRGELAPVTSLVQAPSASPAAQYEDRERKAA